jgi:Bacterial antitoxin of type II TA system, VapB
MASHIRVDTQLVEEAVTLGQHRTRTEAATAALAEYVKLKRRLGLLDLAGHVDFGPTYGYKAKRGRGGSRSRRHK